MGPSKKKPTRRTVASVRHNRIDLGDVSKVVKDQTMVTEVTVKGTELHDRRQMGGTDMVDSSSNNSLKHVNNSSRSLAKIKSQATATKTFKCMASNLSQQIESNTTKEPQNHSNYVRNANFQTFEEKNYSPKKKIKVDTGENNNVIDLQISTIFMDNQEDESNDLDNFLPRRDFVKKSNSKKNYTDLHLTHSTHSPVKSKNKKDLSFSRLELSLTHKNMSVSLQKIPINPSLNKSFDLSKLPNLDVQTVTANSLKQSLASSDESNKKSEKDLVALTQSSTIKLKQHSFTVPDKDFDLNNTKGYISRTMKHVGKVKEAPINSNLFTKDELIQKLHNKTIKIVVEKLCTDGSVQSVPVEATILLKSLIEETCVKKEDVETPFVFTNDISFNQEISDKSEIAFQTSGTLIDNGTDTTVVNDVETLISDGIILSDDTSRFNKLVKKKSVQVKFEGELVETAKFTNVYHDELDEGFQILPRNSDRFNFPVIADQPVDLSAKVRKATSPQVHESSSLAAEQADQSPEAYIQEAMGERRGECKHTMPIWDLHNYCYSCRSNQMYFWTQNCQKNGPTCVVCNAWTSLQWNYKPQSQSSKLDFPQAKKTAKRRKKKKVPTATLR